MLDENCYPDERDLERIKSYSLMEGSIEELLQLIVDNSNYSGAGPCQSTVRRGQYFEYHTFGWSGNEDVIDAVRSNFMFWALAWVCSYRGGHYYFDLTTIMKLERERTKKDVLPGLPGFPTDKIQL